MPHARKKVISKAKCARLWYHRSQNTREMRSSETAYADLVQAALELSINREMAAALGNVIPNILKSSAAFLKRASSFTAS